MKSLHLRVAATALLLGSALGFGALRFLYAAPVQPSAHGEAHLSESASTTKEDAFRLPTREWKLGDSLVYEFDTTRGTSIHGEDSEQVLQYAATGTMQYTVIGFEGNDVRLRVDVQARRVELKPAAKMTSTEAAAWLSRTFFAKIQKSGKISSFLFSKDIPLEARNLLRGFVHSLQWIAPTVHANHWHALEEDVSGQYDAEYQALDRETIEKVKVNYVQMRGARGLQAIQRGTRYGVGSKATFELDDSGWPKRLSEDESVEVKAHGMTAVGTIKTVAALKSRELRMDWVGEFPAELETDAQSDEIAAAKSILQADINLVGGRTLRAITAELNGDQVQKRNTAQGRMAALLRIDPKQAKDAADEVLHGSSDNNAKKRLIGALGNAGTPEAQHELARILDTQDAGELRVAAGISMGLTKHPTEETMSALEKGMTSTDAKVDSTSTLALGGAVRTMNAEGTGDTSDELTLLMDGLARATNDYERKVYIDALGNTGDVRALSAIRPYLSHEIVALRAAATNALKFMAGDLADAAVIAAFADTEAAVRKAAAHTIAFRPIANMLGAIDTLMRSEGTEVIRLEVLQGLAIKVHEDPGVLELVTWVMENDASTKVKSAAKDILDARALEEP